MRIRRRLMWTAILLVAIVTISATVSVVALRNVEGQQRVIVSRELPAAFALTDLRAGALRVTASTSEYAWLKGADGRPAELDLERALVAQGTAKMKDGIDRFAALAHTDADIETAARLRVATEALSVQARRSIDAVDDPTSTPGDLLDTKEAFEGAEDEVLSTIDVALAQETNEVREFAALAETGSTYGVAAVVLTSVLLMGLVSYMSWSLWRATAAPLKQLGSFSLRIGRGETDARTGMERDDEIGELAYAMDTMAHDLLVSTREVEATRAQVARNERLASLGTLVAGVAHEINNPLTYIRGNIELMQLESAEIASAAPALGPKVEALLGESQAALTGIDRIARITTSLKVIARSSMKARQPEDLNLLASSTANVARPRFAPTVALVTDLRARRRVCASGSEVSQILMNLLFNAADATRVKGSIVTIRTFDTGDTVVLEVQDDGPGIPEDKQDHIFTPFFTTKDEGTGLGLSVSHSIAIDHRGSLSFTSKAGVGTTFRLELPILQADAKCP